MTRFVRLGLVLLVLAVGCGDGGGGGGVDAGRDASGDGGVDAATNGPFVGVITAFYFSDFSTVVPVIDNTNRTISITLPFGASRTNLFASITHNGTQIEPPGFLDYTTPQTFTIYGPVGESGGTYTVTVSNAFNTNVNLTLLSIGGIGGGAYEPPMRPAFSPSVTSYTAMVPQDIDAIPLNYIKADANATVTISANAAALVAGVNDVTLTVTQVGGAMKVYTIRVTRLDPADLFSQTVGALERVPAGTYQRDATATNTNTVSAFNMARTEVTRDQWAAVLPTYPDPTNVSDPTRITGTSDPVSGVSWFHTLVFCNTLSQSEGLTPVYAIGGQTNPTMWGAFPEADDGWSTVTANWAANGYRLPTASEWMWAAMGATSGAGYGEPGTFTTGYAKPFAGSTGTNAVTDYAWFLANTVNANNFIQTRPAGSKLPNELLLHDMSGSVFEWVWDTSPGDPGFPDGPLTDYHGDPAWTDYHATYGGGWRFALPASLGASRYSVLTRTSPLIATYYLGFRVVRSGP